MFEPVGADAVTDAVRVDAIAALDALFLPPPLRRSGSPPEISQRARSPAFKEKSAGEENSFSSLVE